MGSNLLLLLDLKEKLACNEGHWLNQFIKLTYVYIRIDTSNCSNIHLYCMKMSHKCHSNSQRHMQFFRVERTQIQGANLEHVRVEFGYNLTRIIVKVDEVFIFWLLSKSTIEKCLILIPEGLDYDWIMMFNATFNNISVISWRSVLLEETEYPDKTTDLPQVTDKLYHIMLYRTHLSCVGFELTTLVAQEIVNPTTIRSRPMTSLTPTCDRRDILDATIWDNNENVTLGTINFSHRYI